MRARLPGAAGAASPAAGGPAAAAAAVAAPDTVHIAVALAEPVTVDTYSGTPVLDMDAGGDAGVRMGGGAPASAAYMSGSGTDTLTFEYEVGALDLAGLLAYKSPSSLRPNGATIIDGSGNAANLTLAWPGDPGSLSNSSRIEIAPSGAPLGIPGGIDAEVLHLRCLLHPLLCRH